MTSRLAIILLMCAAAWGQQPDTTSCIRGVTCSVTESGDKLVPACLKYQHVDPPMGMIDCGIDPLRNCTPHCVDDMHMVTEREWQELMARLKAAEAYRKAGLESTHIAEQCLHDLGVCTDRIDAVRTRVEQEIKALEHPIIVDGSSAVDCKTPPDDPTKPCDKNQPSRKGKK